MGIPVCSHIDIHSFNYFQELNDNKLNAPNSDIKKDLKRLEEEHIFSELDFKMTDKEIIEGIFSLKNKKSSGMDMYKTIEFE